MNDRLNWDERLTSGDLVARVAARLDVIEENLAESSRLGAMAEYALGQAEVTGRRRWRIRRVLLREARWLIAARRHLLDENDQVIADNAADLAANGMRR